MLAWFFAAPAPLTLNMGWLTCFVRQAHQHRRPGPHRHRALCGCALHRRARAQLGGIWRSGGIAGGDRHIAPQSISDETQRKVRAAIGGMR